MVGVTITRGTVLNSHGIRKAENHGSRISARPLRARDTVHAAIRSRDTREEKLGQRKCEAMVYKVIIQAALK